MLEFLPMPRLSAQMRAREIKLLLFDVDGVLTDGKLFFLPPSLGSLQKSLPQSAEAGASSGHTSSMIEFKGFHAHDGVAISLARLGGIKTGVITKRNSETVAVRASDLKLEYVYQGVDDKRACFDDIVTRAGLKLDEAAFVGDDIVDLGAMRAAGLAIAVQNARPEVKKEAHYVTPHAGGEGGLRDAVEFILKAQGQWKRVLEEYIDQKSGPKKVLKNR
jgi:3-deoxy-D-manno-octulosonate 8-phosphate phosphatase (KDO 8-P phosphatase)